MKGSAVTTSPLVLLGTAGVLRAQTGAATVQGTVKDPSGAVVPAARLTLSHELTNRTFETTTNSAGLYIFPSVQPGNRTSVGRPPGLDTIGEFRVETNNSSAKLSRAATAMLSTRSGTNHVRGGGRFS